MCLVAVPFVFASTAAASELIARKATNVKLEVSANGGQALLSYRANGRTWYVLAKGAINARPPKPGGKQAAFTLRRSTTRPPFKGRCTRLQPALPVVVAACAAGASNWAAQEWQRSLPNFGVPPSGIRAHPELHLSHWSGAVAELTLKADWSSRVKWRHVYGKLTYRGKPVYGFGASRFGVPTDPFGRNVYIDTLDSAYGPGWRRENSFLTRKPTGFFCYDFTPHRGGLTGQGREYRGTVIGPGVTPDVRAVVPDPGSYDPALDAASNEEQVRLGAGAGVCRPS